MRWCNWFSFCILSLAKSVPRHTVMAIKATIQNTQTKYIWNSTEIPVYKEIWPYIPIRVKS